MSVRQARQTQFDRRVELALAAIADAGAGFFLVHAVGLHALGITDTAAPQVLDICLTAGKVPLEGAVTHSCYTEGRIRDLPVRIWSRHALGLTRPTRVVRSPLYGCDVLAPDLLLERLDLSPDAAMLAETRALLAANDRWTRHL